jgi:hypothetical protein
MQLYYTAFGAIYKSMSKSNPTKHAGANISAARDANLCLNAKQAGALAETVLPIVSRRDLEGFAAAPKTSDAAAALNDNCYKRKESFWSTTDSCSSLIKGAMAVTQRDSYMIFS